MVVEMFLDTSDVEEYKKYKNLVSGGTTNPSIMSNQGVAKEKYEEHSRAILEILKEGVLSVEVTNVIPSKMYEEAKEYSEWDPRIVIKIPCPFYLDKSLVSKVTGNEFGKDPYDLNNRLKFEEDIVYVNTLPLIYQLSKENVPLNVTCGFGYEQARDVAAVIKKANGSAKNNYFSVFWGRLLDNYVNEGRASQEFNKEDLEKIIQYSSEEVNECARQLEGTNMRIILGSSRLPKIWEKKAKELDESKENEIKNNLAIVRQEAYRALLRVASPVNAIPTIAPALFEAGRYNPHTTTALKGFIEDFLKQK